MLTKCLQCIKNIFYGVLKMFVEYSSFILHLIFIFLFLLFLLFLTVFFLFLFVFILWLLSIFIYKYMFILLFEDVRCVFKKTHIIFKNIQRIFTNFSPYIIVSPSCTLRRLIVYRSPWIKQIFNYVTSKLFALYLNCHGVF